MASSKDESIANKEVSRRSLLKWSGALAAAGVVGIGLGFGGDLLLRQNTTTTETTTATATTTASGTTSTATKTVTNNVTATQTVTQNITQTETQTTTSNPEVLLTMAGDGGPFYAHVVNGQWIKSSPLVPNLPVAATTYYGRNRNYSADRIRYPMQRVDFDPSGNRNPQNRGVSGFVRITWDEAITLVANELSRLKSTYGVGSIMPTPTDHQWIGQLHNSGGGPQLTYPPYVGASGWGSRFWSLFGGCSTIYGSSSNPANNAGGPLAWGMSGGNHTNNVADIIANSKMVIHWATDTVTKNYAGHRQALFLKQIQQAGIKQVMIEPYYNDTAAAFGIQWIPIVPNTDEALLVAIAYVWFTQGLINETFAQNHTVGYSQFKDYVLGNSDGVPKTPQWASAITSVDPNTITQLAKDWASLPTYVMHSSALGVDLGGGAQRRANGVQWVRLLIALSTISGNIGVPGGGLGGISYTTAGTGQKAFGGIPSMKITPVNIVPHIQFGEAILNPPVSFAAFGLDGKYHQYSYPTTGAPPVHGIVFHSGNGFFMNQEPGTAKRIQAIQSSNLEFIVCMTPWWETGAKFSDVVLPTKFLGERDDIVQWENYSIYMHTVCNPVPEAWNDLDIYVALAQKLGFDQQLTNGQTSDQWLQSLYAAASVPLSFTDFQNAGFYKYPDPVQTPVVSLTSFNKDPTNTGKLATPSGLVEIYSQTVATALGSNSPYVIASYVPPTEGYSNPLAQTYPIIMLTPHPKMGRHSQWQNVSWVRTDDQMFRNGYRTVYINSVDAKSRGINDGDVVKVFNQRASLIGTATVSERVMPKTIYVWEGAWYQTEQPGNENTPDIGGNVEALIDNRFGELTSGLVANALVDVQKWNGGA